MLTKIFIGVLICTVIGIVVFKALDPNLENGNNTTIIGDDDNILEDDSSISVGISGEVFQSGNYVLEAESTMADLIDAAGGVTTNADERCYFFDAILVDNMSYYIAPKYELDDVCGNNPIEKININVASLAELDELPDIGETKAKNIIAYREEIGTFYTIEGIKEVDGIGESTFSKIRDKIMLHE